MFKKISENREAVMTKAFFGEGFTLFFALPFLFHNMFIPCGISKVPVVSAFFILRGKYANNNCVCLMNFYLMDGYRNECFFIVKFITFFYYLFVPAKYQLYYECSCRGMLFFLSLFSEENIIIGEIRL